MGASLAVDLDDDYVFDDKKYLLGDYTEEDMREGARRHGVSAAFERAGYRAEDLVFTLDLAPFVQGVVVSTRELMKRAKCDAFLLQLFLRRVDMSPGEVVARMRKGASARISSALERILGGELLRATVIEYLYLQDPNKTFTLEKPQLPSQRHPGLSAGREVFRMICAEGLEHKRQAILNTPENFHNAYLTHDDAKQRFLDPRVEAEFILLRAAMRPLVERHGLAAVSWGVHDGKLLHNGKVYVWNCRDTLMYPLAKPATLYFECAEYREELALHLEEEHAFFLEL